MAADCEDGSAFYRYLSALGSEYEKMIQENMALRKLRKEGELTEPEKSENAKAEGALHGDRHGEAHDGAHDGVQAAGDRAEGSDGSDGAKVLKVEKSEMSRHGDNGDTTAGGTLRSLAQEWEDSASMHSMHSMQSVDAPVAPVVASAAPPPPETPAPFAPDASHPSTPKKTRISLDPAEDPQLPGGVEVPDTSSASDSQTETKDSDQEMSRRKSTATRYSYVKDMQIQEHDDREDNATFFLMLDVVPAIVIMLSAVVAGVSADNDPNNTGWKVLEILFTVFFIGEVIVKLRVFGWKEYLWGPEWYWSWFDILCIILAVVYMGITYTADQEAPGSSALGSMKTLKLARLGRIVRLLKFKIFTELKLMIQGVFTGLRVLFWAIVLLVTCMYLMGVVAVTVFSDQEGMTEFASVSAAMFTAFRCFTDGCAATDGTPLQETLRQRYGFPFMMIYILLFLFVTIGIFNLIMAVFIDNVTDGCTKKRQRELGHNAPKNAWRIAATLRGIILQKVLRKEAEDEAMKEAMHGPPGTARRVSKIFREKWEELRGMYGKPHSTYEYAELTDRIREDMAEYDVVVPRDEFNHWLASHDGLLDTLEDAEIDLSCKSDLFDVLDADMSGELEFEEMIDGLLKCRGPASKTDIIAIRLKARLMVRMMTAICSKLGIKDV